MPIVAFFLKNTQIKLIADRDKRADDYQAPLGLSILFSLRDYHNKISKFVIKANKEYGISEDMPFVINLYYFFYYYGSFLYRSELIWQVSAKSHCPRTYSRRRLKVNSR